MGWDVASEIAYRNLNEYLGNSSDYMDARDFSYEVAADMFGDCSPEAINVIEAWYAVGVGNRLDAAVEPDFLLNYSYACTLPLTINFQNLTEANAYFSWDFGDGNASLNDNPVNSYTQEGNYDILLTAELNNACFSSTKSITKSLQVVELGTPLEATCSSVVTTPSTSIGTNSVSLNGLYYESGMDDDDYNDYTCKTNTTLHIDSVYEMTVLTSLSTKQNVRAWIDFNNNGEFTEDELILVSDGVNGEHIGSVDFDGKNAVAYGKPIRMRVISDILFNNDITSCSDLRFGQTEDYSVVMVDGDGTISSINENLSQIKVFPNPAINSLNITSSKYGKSEYVISDVTGKLLAKGKLVPSINIEILESGLYFISITDNDNTVTKSFIKQ